MLLLLLTCASSVWARSPDYSTFTLTLSSDYVPSRWTHEVGYPTRMMHKLGFGLEHSFLGWTEIFRGTGRYVNDGAAFHWALLKGMGMALIQTAGGVTHLASFPFTEIDVALPNGGIDLEF